MKVAAIVIGIDGWEQYTLPLIKSIQAYEPECTIVVIDNASNQPYPAVAGVTVERTERKCYSAAINHGKALAGDAEWFIVLSNDVLCKGAFLPVLSSLPSVWVAGPHLISNQGWKYLEGWCVCIPAMVWTELGGWDENYQISSWEDVDFSTMAIRAGYNLAHCPDLPFVHLDQKQRFTIVPNYWESETHNVRYFRQKHGRPEGGA